jgi:aryl-alcohol dehydrogenase-like predicted oxidoreductase
MKYIDFNNKKISKLSLGTVQFGLAYGIKNSHGQPSFTQSAKIINYLYGKGVNCFDTAIDYGESQSILGKVLQHKKDLFFVSKLNSIEFKINFTKSLEKIRHELKKSVIDAVLLHDAELLHDWTNNNSTIVRKAKNNNLIKYFGVSIYTDNEFELALKNQDIDIIQVPFNIFDQRALTRQWILKAKENNKFLFIRSIYLQGLIFMDSDRLPSSLYHANKYISMLDEYAKDVNLSKSELALNFVDTIAGEYPILFGCNSLETAQSTLHTYNKLESMDGNLIEELRLKFNNIDETIYNPKKW